MLHEYERMFDAVMGLPPIARGKGDTGVRSKSHADTLVRQFSPREHDDVLTAAFHMPLPVTIVQLQNAASVVVKRLAEERAKDKH